MTQFIHILTDYFTVQYHLPDANVINKDFLKEVLTGKKSLMKKSDVKKVNIPHYDELSVKALWP